LVTAITAHFFPRLPLGKDPGCDPLYAWHRDPAGHRIGQLLMLFAQLFQPGIERLDFGFEEPKLTQQATSKNRW
jgi:hypothetical protein